MTREELIAALESATGPSRELDFQIADAVGWPDSPYSHAHARRYTSSLDAALMLVPEGWRWSLDWTQRPPYRDCGRADLYAPGSGIKPPDVCDVYAATPALALAAAALKAQGGGA